MLRALEAGEDAGDAAEEHAAAAAELQRYLRKISGYGMMGIADSIAYKHLRNKGIGSHYTILPHEYETAFREIKEAKHTTLFDIGGVSAKIA